MWFLEILAFLILLGIVGLPFYWIVQSIEEDRKRRLKRHKIQHEAFVKYLENERKRHEKYLEDVKKIEDFRERQRKECEDLDKEFDKLLNCKEEL